MSGDLDLLTGPEAGGLLEAAAAAAGGTVVSWRAKQVTHQVRSGTTVAYRARVRWSDGRVADETLAACTGDLPEGALVLADGADRVALWRFPHDPDLPGLPSAFDERHVASVFRDLGLADGSIRLAVRAYRPRRRAVIEAVGPRGRLFVKVVRPDRVEALHDRHRLLVANGIPVPQSLGWTDDGLLVLQALPGRTLRQTLKRRAVPVPSGSDLLDLLDRLPAALADGRPRHSWLDRVGHYAAVVAAAAPECAEQVVSVSEAITTEAGTGPIVPSHGDFYESQLLVDGGRVCGLLDVDTAGPGERLDDLACLLGHLSVLAQIQTDRAAAINRVGARYLAAFEQAVDPADLRYRVAAVIVSLATGPHRVQEARWRASTRRRVELAERWLDSARRSRAGDSPPTAP